MQAATQTWNPTIGATNKWYMRWMPCLTDLAFLLPVFLLFGRLSGTKLLFGDSDTGWHIRTGEWILDHRAVPTEDFFSFTKPHQAWFAWEWGWDLLFASIHKFWGLGGVAFVNVIVLGAVSVLLYKLVLRASGNEIVGFFVTALAICGSSLHWLARPHLLSWVFFLLFLHLIRDLQESRGGRSLYLLPAVTVAWVNIHPSFFLGILLLLLAALGDTLEELMAGRRWQAAYERCFPLLLSAATCAFASLLNPYAWHLHWKIFQSLTSGLMNNIQEYQSVNFRYTPAGFFECMLLLAAASVFWNLQAKRIGPAISVIFWTHAALLAGRNVPLFLMVAAPVVACMLRDVLSHLSTSRGFGAVCATISEICEELRPWERLRRFHAVSALAVLLLAALFASGASGFESQFDPDRFPATAIPIVEASSARRIFASDQWGGYLIYRLYPSKQVFIDGRADVFGRELSNTGIGILNARFDWSQQLDHFAVDMVLIKPDAPLATVLKTSPGWRMLFDDGKAIVFQAKLPTMQTSDRRPDRRPPLSGAL
jgi:uncharacterized membrane protein